MTSEPDNSERDPALAAAWRKHSAEMPSAALDAAILAAAHRAAGSAPRGIAPRGGEPQDAGKPAAEATSPQRWWMPLAAAATIGAVALGILQIVPQEHPVTTSSVSDTPARAAGSTTPLPSAPSDKLDVAERKDAPRVANEQATPQTSIAAATQAPAAPADQTPAPAARRVLAEPAPAMAPGKPAAKIVAPPPAPSTAPPEPFPAEKKNEAAESGDFKNRVRAVPPPSAAPAVGQSSELARADTYPRSEARQAPAATGAMALGKTAADADAASITAVDVDAWIVRIRKLHDDGKLADAAKELVALRKAVPGADLRLPPDLRTWAATVKP